MTRRQPEDLQDPRIFEDEVRRIARQLWPESQYSGSEIRDGRERDGVFETEECVHLIEATTSRKKEKAEKDVGKMMKLARKLQASRPSKVVKSWFITLEEPTADQRGVIDKHRPRAVAASFQQFQAKLIDARAYLAARNNYSFGSVRDPDSGDTSPAVEYVPLDILAEDEEVVGTVEVAEKLDAGMSCVLVGGFGSGKSMTLREVYRQMTRRFMKGETSKFPVYLNLRDHWGQTNPAEALERHARNVGFAFPSHLVRAWRSGYTMLLLDGFDELSSLGMQGIWKKLVEVRRRSMTLVRTFAGEHPRGVGILVAGRDNFFQNNQELRSALGLPRDSLLLSLNEFTSEQIQTYLERVGLNGAIPSWLPSRPLLVGYLASRGLLSEFGVAGSHHPLSELERSVGWDSLIGLVSEREAAIEAGIDGTTVRSILERLSSRARCSESGLGPLDFDDLALSFEEVCGYRPESEQLTILQRLPGLGIDQAEEETRSFLDEDFADTCRAGDILRFVWRPFELPEGMLRDFEMGLGDLAVEVAVLQFEGKAEPGENLNSALQRAQSMAIADYMTLDLLKISLQGGYRISSSVSIRDLLIPRFEFDCDQITHGEIRFSGCLFSHLEILASNNTLAAPVRFEDCYIAELDGLPTGHRLLEELFDESCSLDNVNPSVETTKSLMSLQLPQGARVLLTVLKKIFQQKGSGRRENALYKGLDHRSQRLVGDVLRNVQSLEFATPINRRGDTIWIPDRRKMSRAGRILSSPSSSSDELMKRCRDL